MFRLSKLEVAVVIGVIGVLIAILLPAVREARESARRTQSRNNLKQIVLACHNYHDVYEVFPVGGTRDAEDRPQIGWMTQILHYLEAGPGYPRTVFERPWDDPINHHVMAQWMPSYLIPGVDELTSEDRFALTHYLGNPSCFHLDSSLSIHDFSNGTANSWIIGEVAGEYTPWGYPFNWRAWDGPLNDGLESFGRPTGEGAFFAMADGTVRMIDNDIAEETREALSGGMPNIPPAATNKPIREFTYRHEQVPTERIFLTPEIPDDDWPYRKTRWILMIYRDWDGNPTSAVVQPAQLKGMDSPPPLSSDILQPLHTHCPDVPIMIMRGPMDSSICEALQDMTHLRRLLVFYYKLTRETKSCLRSQLSLEELIIEQ